VGFRLTRSGDGDRGHGILLGSGAAMLSYVAS
jgi:hypothetical protein